MSEFAIGVDIGGTFTDCVIADADGVFVSNKAPTTPSNPAIGFFNAIEVTGSLRGLSLDEVLGQSRAVVHGTTVGTNAVVSRTGSKVGLLATVGHGEAILHMRGGGRSKGLGVDELLFVPGTEKPEPLVPKSLIAEVVERVDSKGDVVVELNEEGAKAAIRRLLDAGVEAIAIAFMWSFKNGDHERRVAELVREADPDVYVTCSADVSPTMGEYPRTVAAVVNAYLGPLMQRYTGEIVQRAAGHGYTGNVLFSQSAGGSMSARQTVELPLLTLDSGPVSGILGSAEIGATMGHANVITTDMGGTTFDVGIVQDGVPLSRTTAIVHQYEFSIPMIDVVSIGSGGGSIAWIDESSGTIRVGPQSAGADPGPICYGAGGTEPTVTDANLVLGVIDPQYFLGGRQELDVAEARAGIARLGERLKRSVEETAAGIVEIVDRRMANEIRRMTVFRGLDPREMVVFSFGGAGPTHAGRYAAELGVGQVIVPLGNAAATWSALGALAGNIVKVAEAGEYMREPLDAELLAGVLAELERSARAQLQEEGFDEEGIEVEHFVGMRYGAQVFDLEIKVTDSIVRDHDVAAMLAEFERAYAARFGAGSGHRQAGIEVMKQRVVASGSMSPLTLPKAPAGEGGSVAAERPARDVYWHELAEFVRTPVYDGLKLGEGELLHGPVVIELPQTTIPVRPGHAASVDRFGSIVLDLRAGTV